MTEEERAFKRSCDVFKNYSNIDEYIADIRQLLMIGIINRRYTEQAAEKIVQDNMHFIEDDFSNGIDAVASAVDIAYCCG